MKKAITSIFLFSILFLNFGHIHAQDWDYDLYPRMDIELTHLDAELKIESDGRLLGNLIYSATLKNSFSDSLFFDAAGLDIQTVTINGNEVEFLVEDQKLIIVPEERLLRNQEVQVGINYAANPAFGTHTSASGTIWTSLLPLTTQHWLPIIDSPRVELLTDYTITHPAGSIVVANGRKGVSEVVDTETERTAFSTENPISASSLGWVLFDEAQTASTSISNEIRNSYSLFSRRSDPQIYVYSEIESNPEELLLTAADIFSRVSSELDIDFLHGDLHVIVLEDDFLETKQFGDGLLFVYENKGDIKKQIEQGIISMFAESMIKAPSWSDADAARIIEAALMNRFDVELNSSADKQFEPYNVYSTRNLALWQQFLEESAPDVLLEGIEIIFENVSDNNAMTASWSEFSDLIYDETGRFWLDGFELPEPKIEEADATYSYSAVIDWEEGSSSAEVRFEADSFAVDELVTVDAEVIGLHGSQERELTFTGATDGIVLNVPSTLDNIKLTVRDRSDVVLNTKKPFLFWMYQLRNDEDEGRRAEAAIGISSYGNNPDIELLLNDVLRSEESDIVIAAVLRAMSEITDGASGTDERFLQFAGSNQAMNIRIAAVETLAKYDGNERVLSRLQSIVRQESNETLKQTALKSISEIVEPQRFSDIAGAFITQEVVSGQISYLLEILAEKGSEEQAVELADRALEMNLPHQATLKTVRFLINVDQSPDNWFSRLPDLLQNTNPGIRIAAAEATEKLSTGDRESLIEDVMPNEFDERVRRKLRGE